MQMKCVILVRDGHVHFRYKLIENTITSRTCGVFNFDAVWSRKSKKEVPLQWHRRLGAFSSVITHRSSPIAPMTLLELIVLLLLIVIDLSFISADCIRNKGDIQCQRHPLSIPSFLLQRAVVVESCHWGEIKEIISFKTGFIPMQHFLLVSIEYFDSKRRAISGYLAFYFFFLQTRNI